jgi:hypothetical protein
VNNCIHNTQPCASNVHRQLLVQYEEMRVEHVAQLVAERARKENVADADCQTDPPCNHIAIQTGKASDLYV